MKVNRQLQDPLDWQLSVNRTLATESPDRFGKNGILSQEEMKEADKARTSGMSGEEFARQIAERDRQAQQTDRSPVDFPKPLSPEHERIIALLQEHYDHTDRPVLLFEGEHYVTLRIPRVLRTSIGGGS